MFYKQLKCSSFGGLAYDAGRTENIASYSTKFYFTRFKTEISDSAVIAFKRALEYMLIRPRVSLIIILVKSVGYSAAQSGFPATSLNVSPVPAISLQIY